MINASSAFRRKLNNDERDYLEQISMTLKDGTELSLTNADIWGGSLSFDDSVGSDGSFSALGSCIVNSLKFTLNNIYDDFSEYDFLDATATVKIGLDIDGTPEMLKKGKFTVVDPTYNGSTISLVLHDNMAKFDRPYSDSTLAYPASLDTIVRNLCAVCGVNLATSSLNFPRKDFVINERPSDEATTCREVLSWCATIAGCFARCNADGELELKWFNINQFEDQADNLDGGTFDSNDPNVYTSGDSADGGTFNPWNTGDAYEGGSLTYFGKLHIIRSLYSQNIAVDDVVITQIQAEVKVKADTGDAVVTYSEGQPGYAIKISGNEFINETNAQGIVTYLGNQIIGTTFRKANISHSSDPSIEAGDCAVIYDRKGNEFHILITRTKFTVGSAQTTVCGADTPARNSAARYSEQTKSYVEIRKKLIEQKSEWEQAVDDLSDRIDNAGGMYETDVQQTGGGVIHYLHNKPLLAESDIRIVVSDVGVTVTANGTDPNPTWYGLTVDGQLIASILNTIGVNADWIHSGTLKLGGDNNTNGLLEVYNASNVKIGKWDKDGADITGKLTLDSNTITAAMGSMLSFDFKTLIDGNTLFRQFTGDGLRLMSKSHPKYSTYVSPDRIICFKNNTIDTYTSITDKLFRQLGESLYYIEDGSSLYYHDIAHGDAFGMALGKYTLASAFPDDDTETSRKVSRSDNVQVMIGSRGLAIGNSLIFFGTDAAYDCYIGSSWGTWYRAFASSSSGTTNYGIFIDYRSAAIILNGSRDTINSHSMRYTTSGLTVNGNTVAYQSTSSIRYKHNIELLHDSNLDPHRLYNLKAKQFRYNLDVPLQYKDMYGQTLPGFIAEDVAEIYPAAVIHNVENPDDIESWDERRIIPPMLSLMQEQHEQIEQLTDRVNQLERLVNQLLEERTNA